MQSPPPTQPADAEQALRPSANRSVEFPCSNCGAGMRWEPDLDALGCEHCGHRVEVPRGDRTIVERSLEEAGEAARGLGVATLVASCQTCGARVAFDERETARACVYCGSASVLGQEANRNALRPESLVPLDIGAERVRQVFREWIGGLWFRPAALRRTSRFRARGVYVPFWTFDARVHSEWSADAGTYYWDEETHVVRVNGRAKLATRRVQKIRWRPAWGERDDAYDDLLVNASTGLRGDLVRKLGAYDTKELVPYEPHYLAGWSAEEYGVDLSEAWEQGRSEIESLQRARCAADVPGDTHRNLRAQHAIRDVRWKHVLLPVWSLQYEFRGKTCTVLVHGQSGRCVGDAPYSWVKIALFAAGVLLAGLLLAALL